MVADTGTILRPELPPVTVSAEMILRMQKYRDTAPPPVRAAAQRAALEAMRLCDPRAVVWRGAVEHLRATGEATPEDGADPPSRALTTVLAGAEEALVLVLTIGAAVERQARERVAQGRLLDGLLLDTAAWVAVEAAMRALRRGLELEERARGRTLGARIAPGYSDWPLAAQHRLFALFGDQPMPVRLNGSACMVPRKSLSAVFGVRAQ